MIDTLRNFFLSGDAAEVAILGLVLTVSWLLWANHYTE